MMFCSCVYIILFILIIVNCSYGFLRRMIEGEFIMYFFELEMIFFMVFFCNVVF